MGWGGGEFLGKNGVKVDELFLKLVIGLSHMIEQVYWLNQHVIFLLSHWISITSENFEHVEPGRYSRVV